MFLAENIVVFSGKCWQHLGCWKDDWTRAIEEEMVTFVDNPINKCHDRAAGKSYAVFAAQYGDECYTAADAWETYTTYGESDNCRNGVGGVWAQDVYRITTCTPGTTIFSVTFNVGIVYQASKDCSLSLSNCDGLIFLINFK